MAHWGAQHLDYAQNALKRPFAGRNSDIGTWPPRNSLYTNDLHPLTVPGTGRRCNLWNTNGLRRRLSFALTKRRIPAYNGARGLLLPILAYIPVYARCPWTYATHGGNVAGRAIFFTCHARLGLRETRLKGQDNDRAPSHNETGASPPENLAQEGAPLSPAQFVVNAQARAQWRRHGMP